MKNQKILILMIGVAVFATSPAFAMLEETPDGSKTITHKTTAKTDEPTPQLPDDGVPKASLGFDWLGISGTQPQGISSDEVNAIIQSATAGDIYVKVKLRNSFWR